MTRVITLLGGASRLTKTRSESNTRDDDDQVSDIKRKLSGRRDGSDSVVEILV